MWQGRVLSSLSRMAHRAQVWAGRAHPQITRNRFSNARGPRRTPRRITENHSNPAASTQRFGFQSGKRVRTHPGGGGPPGVLSASYDFVHKRHLWCCLIRSLNHRCLKCEVVRAYLALGCLILFCCKCMGSVYACFSDLDSYDILYGLAFYY